ncbi:MAG: MBG domain-containing protein [Patescibacteria group bacterium]
MAFADPIFSVTAAVEAVDVGQTKDLTFNVIKATGETALKTIAISEVGTGFSSPTSIVCPTGWSVIPAMPPIVNGYVCNDPTGVGLDSTSITLKGMIAPASAGVKDFSVSAINTGAEPKTENVKTQITVKDLKATATISPITTNINQERTYTLNLTNNSATPGDDITQVSGTLAGFNITSCSTTSWTTCTPSGDSFILSDGSLAPTNSVDISVIATAPANSGAQTVSAQITGALGGTANATISQNVIQVQTPADLAIGDITSDKVYISKNSGAINSSTVSADITNNGKATANTLVKTLVIKDALGVDISNQFVITEATTTAELLGNETKTLSWIVTANASTSIEALVKAEVSVGYNDINTGVIAITGPATKVNDQIFTVDNTAPVIVSHSDEVVEATGHSGAIVKYTAPSATDNMDTSATISSCTPVSGTTFSIGSTTITCVSSDKAGNVATPAVFVINVVDTTAPVITMKDVSPITLEYGKSYTDAGATALDIVDLSVSVIASGTVNTLILGTYEISYNAVDAHNNHAIQVVRTVNVVKKAITVAANAQTKTYGEVDPELTYTFTPALISGDSFTGTLSRAAGKNVGTYAIAQNTLTLTAGDNYNLTYVGANLTISKRAITITATTDTKPYDSTITSTATSTMTSGTLANSETATWTQTFDDKNVGTGRTLTPTGSVADGNDGKNYEMTFVNSAGAITAISAIGSVAVDSKVYDGATTATINNRSLSGVISNDTVSYVGGTASFDTKDVGIGKIVSISGLTLFGADAGNYTVNDTATTTANITTLPITITADTQTKTYGEADPILLTYTFTPALISGDSFGTSIIARAVDENVGTYAITQNGLTAGDNYAITFVGANLTINKKAITITADAQTKVYGEANLGLTYTIANGSLVGTDTATGTLSRVAGENVGTYAITQNTLTAGDNYNLTYVGANLTISKRAITITATTDTKPYDSTITSTATSTMTSGTLANSETATWTQTFDDKNVGTKTLTPTGSVADGNNGKNYDVTFVNNTGAIAAISAIGSVVVDSKVYDGTTTATIKNRSLSGVISNDTVSYVGGSANFDTKNVGIGKIVSISGLTISGADAGNYTVNDTATTTANIATLPITITADTQTKTYGEDDPTLLTYTFTPALISGDSFTGVLIRAVGENVGIYAITQNGLTAGTNYVITFVGANLTINPGLATQANIVADYVTAEVSSTTVKLTITVKDVGGNLVADGTTVALTTSLGEVIGLDTTKNGVVSRALTSNTVGNAILTISGLTVSGSTTINFKDTTKPVIVGLTPSKGSSTSNVKPTISAQFTEIGSGINKNKVTLVVDLDDVTEFATITDSGISYVPPFEMSTGFHNVTVNVSDNTGNEASSTWKFAIIDPAVIVAPLSVSQWPVDGTTGVDLNAHPYIQFSKLMNENTLVAGNVEIRLHDAQTTAVSSAIVISTVNNATRVTFIPNSSLTPNVKYFFYIGSGVKDLAVYSLNATWTTANKESHEFTTRALYTNWNISLNQGWNLISLPLIPTNSHISAVLAGISSKVDIAKYYDATTSSWLSYVPGVGGTLTTMEDGKGYWINMKSAGTLNITGVEMPIAEEFPPMYSFVENKWNLIGFKSVVNMTAGDYINGYTKASYNDEILWNYKSGQYSSTNAMESGYGYWLFVK